MKTCIFKEAKPTLSFSQNYTPPQSVLVVSQYLSSAQTNIEDITCLFQPLGSNNFDQVEF